MRFALLMLLALSSRLSATSDVYVDALNGDDLLGLGTQASPFRTITKGVQSLAGAGPHAVHVAPGTYDAALGETFPIVVKDDVSLLGSGTHETILSGGGSGTLVDLRRSALVSDATLRRGDVGVLSPPSAGFAMNYVRRCAIVQCDVGVYAYDSVHNDHGIAIVSSAIAANGVGVRAKTQWCDFNSVTVQLYGSTITGNAVGIETVKEFNGCELYLGLFDSIVRGNGSDAITGWTSYYAGATGNVLSEPSLVGIGGNVDVDPLLAEGLVGDVHLAGTSPVVDLPAPAAPWPPQAMWLPLSEWVWEQTFAEVGDLDGGARVLGAKIDPGADERLVPALYPWLDASLGATMELRGVAAPDDLLLVYLGSGLLDPPLLGFIWLAPPWFLLGSIACGPDGLGALSVSIPNDPVLAGLDVHVQAGRLSSGGLDGTNPVTMRLIP